MTAPTDSAIYSTLWRAVSDALQFSAESMSIQLDKSGPNKGQEKHLDNNCGSRIVSSFARTLDIGITGLHFWEETPLSCNRSCNIAKSFNIIQALIRTESV